jgi:hypothetical protein
MTQVETISFPDEKLRLRLGEHLKKTGEKKSPCILKAIDEYLTKRGV